MQDWSCRCKDARWQPCRCMHDLLPCTVLSLFCTVKLDALLQYPQVPMLAVLLPCSAEERLELPGCLPVFQMQIVFRGVKGLVFIV